MRGEGWGEGASASARVCLGIITGVHGIRGWVRVKSFTAAPEAIAAYGPLQDESGTRRFTLDLMGAGKGVLLARLAGVDDRNAAERLKGLRLYVRRADLPPPEDGEFYQTDLIGLTATLEDGSAFGTVRAVNDFGAGASIEIEDSSGKAVVLPFTSAAVPVVDVANRRLVVAPPSGLHDAPAGEPSDEGEG
ncbi:MAG TPA: ribosome maturation factor RimM [Stellaceae bacterium]|nr:ribosome maturation factor RimM [Stellaceae bacterium]